MNSKPFYKTWWGIILLFIFWPFSLTYWIWKKNWNLKLRLGLLIPFWFFIILVGLAKPQEQSGNRNVLGETARSSTFADLNKTEIVQPTSESLIIPTNLPTAFVIPSATPIPVIPSNTPIIHPSPTLILNRQRVKVIQVVDGDTIKIEGRMKVRYIGINTPETVDFNKPVECYGQEASNKNKELVSGKTVELEKDVSETDKYGRLLRYVWLGDTLINEYLVREGYAQVSTYPPDVKYQDIFLEAQRLAREEGKGLWSGYCDNTTVQLSPTQSTVQQKTTTSNSGNSGAYTCNCSKICDKMSSCDEAYYQLRQCGCSKRDGDKDGVPCENICPDG